MKCSRLTTLASLAISAGLITTATATAAPAQADPATDAFLAALGTAGVGGLDPMRAIAVGQSVCGMLAQPGQTAVDVAAKVADAVGMPLSPATSLTGLAISTFCPSMLARLGIGNGVPEIPIPLPLFGP